MNAAAMISFTAGVASVQHWSRLPVGTEWLSIAVMAALFWHWRWRTACYLLLGVLWAAAFAQWRLFDSLADTRQGRDVTVQGYVVGLPKQADNRVGFDFIVKHAPEGVPGTLRLTWYSPRMPVKAGQSLELTVRLRKPHGRSNPGGFDYESWLFANHVGATGYIRPEPAPRGIEPVFAVRRYLASGRQALSDRLDAVLPESAWSGMIKALTVGSQDAIGHQQWELFRKTGTVHLMVISGSHISLIAGLVFLCVRRAWAYWGAPSLSPQTAAALMAWLAALFYVALAGFSIPTRRALIMLTVGLWSLAWQRNISALRVLLIALFAVVLFDPLAPVSAGFWLSFAAVALLMFISSGRLGRSSYWREAGKLHVAMAVGLAPLLILFFQQVSIISPLANWVAVPVIALLVTPLALLAAVLALISPVLASFLLLPLDKLLQGLAWLLQYMAAWRLASVSCLPLSWYGLGFAMLGIVLLLAPKGLPGRYLGPFFLLPLAFGKVEKPEPGDVWLTLLDVGQGLSAVVQTANHVLIYDTGAKYSEQSDMGESVILPFLKHSGISAVDRLVISHGESDHSGGAASLIAEIPVNAVYSSAKDWAQLENGQYCVAGQSWVWDGVSFEMLSPGAEAFQAENDNSCVLKISTSWHSLLLSGDIEREAERWLVEHHGTRLASTVLVAPHHGSNTSSHSYFLDQVDPKVILIAAGYQNRFRLPHRLVLQRFRKRHIPSLISGEQGAVTVRLGRNALQLASWRQRNKRYWMADD